MKMLLMQKTVMRTLFLDHFYCVVPSQVHLALKDFFLRFKSADSYLVSSDHGTWNGIYVFPSHGGFLEFIEESDRDPQGTHGIAFSRHGDEAGLHAELSGANAHLNWAKHERKKADGSTYYISSYPDGQDQGLFLWGMEYHNDNGQRIRAKGKSDGNPIQSILSVEMKIQEPLYGKLEEHLRWGARVKESQKERKTFAVPQSDGTEFHLFISPSEAPNSSFAIEILVDPETLPRIEHSPEFTVLLKNNILNLRYSGE